MYLINKYTETKKFPDSYCLFLEKAISLLKTKGILSFITPNTFCELENCNGFRNWLLKNYNLRQIWQSGWAFKDAVVDTIVFVIKKERPTKNSSIEITIGNNSHIRSLNSFVENDLQKIDYRNTKESKNILNFANKKLVNLGTIADIKAGVKLYEKGKGEPPQTSEVVSEKPFSSSEKIDDKWRVLYRGKHIDRYQLKPVDEYVNYGPWLAAPRSNELFVSPKILMRRTDDKLRACVESDSSIAVNSCHVIKLIEASDYSYEYILCLLNSRLMQRIFELMNPQMVGKVFAEIKVVYVERLPIPKIDFSNQREKSLYDQLVLLGTQMLAAQKNVLIAKTPHENEVDRRKIDILDKQIDQLIFKLYGLKDEEINMIESSFS